MEANAGIEARLSAKLQGSIDGSFKYKCVENFEGEESLGSIRVAPGTMVFSSLKDLKAN